MPGLIFENQAPTPAIAPNRTDIALFAGFVQARPHASLPTAIADWLSENGWTSKPYGRPVDQLLDVPVPVENWSQFDQLFEWETRTSSTDDGSTYLGAALRSFFAQGGRKCYVVRVGDPYGLQAPRQQRLQSIAKLIPGYPNQFNPSPADRFSWSGVGHLFGLPDVSLVCLPDLAETCALDRQVVPLPDPPPVPAEVFEVCTPAPPAPPLGVTVRDIGAPRCDQTGYKDWANAVNLVTAALAARVREAEFIAAIPLADSQLSFFDSVRPTAFLQLAYPWIRTPGSVALPETLESPEGALAGILARNALLRGTFRSAANLPVADIFDVSPQLSREQLATDRLIERVSLIGPSPTGLLLVSDVTMSLNEIYRPASVSRLVSAIVRTSRRLGEDITFEPSGERIWGQVRGRLNDFLRGLYELGALRGNTPEESYQVRCDRSTMSQNDIDNGRVIAVVQFDAAAPVDTITVVLIMNEGRQTAVLASEAA